MTNATERTPEQPQVSAVVERLPRARETIIVTSGIPTLDTGMFEHMQRIAKMMASSSLVPAHLNAVRKVSGNDVPIEPQEAVANCFLVVNQAIRWRMDPFAVAQHVYVTSGRIGYEGKLVAAVINSHPDIEKRLTYAYEGAGENRKVTVTAKLKDDPTPRSIEGNVKDWRTTRSGSPWTNANQHDQMLAYRGAREWARRWLPEAVLGVWGDDEIDQFESTQRTLAHDQPAPTHGPAGLRAAMERNGNVTDAEVVGDKKPVAEPEPEKQAEPEKQQPKQEGSPAVRDAIVGKMKKADSVPKLDLERDQANAYAWTKPDLAVIDQAYRVKKEELDL